MKSPFPGMDPYLERHWPDVHTSLIVEARRVLNRLLPPGLVARTEERVAVEAADDREQGFRPDVRVVGPARDELSSGAILIDAPFRLAVELDPAVERFIRILTDDGQLICVLEFVSPANKRQPGLDDFRHKREALLRGGVHFVEIDLVRAGDWRALMRPEVCPTEAISPFRCVIRTALGRPMGYLFPVYLDQPLPEIPIPLRPGDAELKIPLQSLLDTVYEDGRYAQTLDYQSELEPALDSENREVVRKLVAGR